MIAAEPESPKPLLDEEAPFNTETRAPLLTLEPVERAYRLPPVLLDGRCQLAGGDGDDSSPSTEIDGGPEPAVIQQIDGQLVVRAGKLPVWINGESVAESPLREGDRLKFGGVEFCVRTATTEELLANLPGRSNIYYIAGDSGAATRLNLRRARLRAVRERLKERFADLECEFERLRAERTQFEAECQERRQERLPGGTGQKSSAGPARVVAMPQSGSQDPLAFSPPTDSERMNRLFQKQVRQPAAASSPPPAAESPDLPATTNAPLQAPPEAKPAVKESDATDSVADYMESLLGRLRAGRAADFTPEVQVYDDWDRGPKPVPVIDPSVKLGPAMREAIPDTGAGEPSSPSGSKQQSVSRRRVCPIQVRAELRSFREVANASARSAVSSHTLRKLKRSVRWLLPLTTVLLLIAALYLFNAISHASYSWLTFTTAVLAIAALTRLAVIFRKIRGFDSGRISTESECAAAELPAEGIESATDASGPEANTVSD